MKAVIFDCDGVLVDSEPVYAKAFSDTLGDFGCPLPAGLLAVELQGRSMDDCYRWLAKHWGFVVTSAFRDALFSRTDTLIPALLKPILEVGLLVEELTCPKAVASNGVRRSVLHNLELCQLKHHFDPHIYTAEQVALPKPAPDIYLHAASKLQVSPQDCLVIEDSYLGVQSALAAGMQVCWFGGEEHFNEPLQGRSVFKASTMSGVRQVLKKLQLL